MRAMSRRKYRITAVSVPSWVIAVNAAPGSEPSRSPTIRRCALDDTGQELGQPLDESQKDRFAQSHGLCHERTR